MLEDRYVEFVKAAKSALKIPVAAKLTPFFTSLTNMAKRIDATGVNGMVLFNRFYQPDLNLDALDIQPNVLLSTSEALRLPSPGSACCMVVSRRISPGRAASTFPTTS